LFEGYESLQGTAVSCLRVAMILQTWTYEGGGKVNVYTLFLLIRKHFFMRKHVVKQPPAARRVINRSDSA